MMAGGSNAAWWNPKVVLWTGFEVLQFSSMSASCLCRCRDSFLQNKNKRRKRSSEGNKAEQIKKGLCRLSWDGSASQLERRWLNKQGESTTQRLIKKWLSGAKWNGANAPIKADCAAIMNKINCVRTLDHASHVNQRILLENMNKIKFETIQWAHHTPGNLHFCDLSITNPY